MHDPLAYAAGYKYDTEKFKNPLTTLDEFNELIPRLRAYKEFEHKRAKLLEAIQAETDKRYEAGLVSRVDEDGTIQQWKWGLETELEIPHSKACEEEAPCWFCRSTSGFIVDTLYITAYTGFWGVRGFLHKPHYACFDCCRGWKSPICTSLGYREGENAELDKYVIYIPKSKCTRCNNFGKYVGLNFRPPPAKDKKGWARSKRLFEEHPKIFEAACARL